MDHRISIPEIAAGTKRWDVHNNSDIDIAVWSYKFTGEGLIDMEMIRPILRKYKRIDLKMYPKAATAQEFDPFIQVIESTGRVIFISTAA